MKTLRRKLARDLWRLRYQCFTIALLVGCGIASFVAAVSASASVQASRDAFYSDARFADVFAHLKAAPRPVLDRLRELPGVATVEGRVVGDYRVVIEESDEAVVAHFVSVSWPEDARINRTVMQSGRQVEPGSSDEIVLSSTFAETWNLLPGSTLKAVINGRLAKLRVVGVGDLAGVRVGIRAPDRPSGPVALRGRVDGWGRPVQGDGVCRCVQRRRDPAHGRGRRARDD